MKPSEELFRLIKSLTKSEKRYFHINYSGDKVYQKLFDLLEKQDEYDEQEIADKMNIKQIHVYKNYLYKLLLKSLRSFQAESSPNSILYNQLHNFDILFAKGLFKQAEKSLIKSKLLAQASHRRFILSEIYQLGQKLLFMMPRGKDQLSKMNFLSQQEILTNQFDVVRGQQLAYEITRHFYRSGFLINEEIKEDITVIYATINEILLQVNDFLIYKYWTNYLFHCMNGNFFAAFESAQKFVEIADHSQTVFDLSILSCDIAYSHARCTIRINELTHHFIRYKIFPHDFLIRLPVGHYASKTIDLMNLYLFYETGQYKAGLAYWKSLPLNTSYEVTDASIVIHHAACILYFCEENFKEALKHCNWIINESNPGIRDDFYMANLLIRIIIHFEMGSYEVAEDLILKMKRPLKEYTFFQPFDELLLKKLKSAMLAKTKIEFRKHMQELHNGFEVLSPQIENLSKLKIYFNFQDWIKSKVDNKKFWESIQEAKMALLIKQPYLPA